MHPTSFSSSGPFSSQVTGLEVPRRHGLTYEQFRDDYLFPNAPVILTGAMDDWGAMRKWSPRYFKEQYGSEIISVENKKLTLSQFIDWVNRSTPEDPAPYFRNQVLMENFPELIRDVDENLCYFQPNWLKKKFFSRKLEQFFNRSSQMEIYIGGLGRGFPVLHYDNLHTHAFLMQIFGEKRFYLFSPEETPKMYPRPNAPNLSLLFDVEWVDPRQFPLFSQARGSEFILKPGEILFIPSGWWHTTKMLSPSISLSVNMANDSNWDALVRDLCSRQPLYKALTRSVYLGGIGLNNRWRGRSAAAICRR